MLIRLHQNFNLPEFKLGTLNPCFGSSSSTALTRCSRTISSDTNNEESVQRIREMFDKISLSVSAYDTAWVAMVASRESPNKPCFPECLNWVMENQEKDGSWSSLRQPSGHGDRALLIKDSLLSTLACLLALRKWQVADQLLLRGCEFIGSNGLAAYDPLQFSPVGFDVLFAGMIKHSKALDLNLALDETLLDRVMRNQKLEFERIRENETGLAYFAEGIETFSGWEKVLKVKRTNGSLRNSPAAIAATLNHHYDHKLFGHLRGVMNKCEEGVPTINPSGVYIRLKMIDVIENLGLKRYFTQEIDGVLEETYRLWKRRDEDIFLDVNCCAMAFRHLRLGGYEVCQDELEEFSDEKRFLNTTSPEFSRVTTILELYRAANSIIFEDEYILEKIIAWTTTYLKQQLLNQCILDTKLQKEVEFTLRNYNGSLRRVLNRKCIELYYVDGFQMLKTAYRCFNISNMDLLTLSIGDFNACQTLHQDEFQRLKRWIEMNGLQDIFSRPHGLHSSYFMITADAFEPELSMMRIAFAQTIILTTVADDLFDKSASREELLNIVELVKEWDKNSTIGYCSKRVEIFISALYNTVDEIAEKALIYQGRCVKQHLISMWQEMLGTMMEEHNLWRQNTKPKMEEYMAVAAVTVGAHICILTGLYFVGPKLSEQVMASEEIRSLFTHVSTLVRLLNDIRTCEKELSERTLNSVSILVDQGRGTLSTEEAKTRIERMVESSRRELLRMVLQTQGSLVPRECKDLFWTCTKISFYLYKFTDEFASPNEIIKDTKSVIFEPIQCPTQIRTF